MYPAIVNKFLVALATAIATLAIVVQDGVTTQEWLIIALNTLGAIGVYAVPNATERKL